MSHEKSVGITQEEFRAVLARAKGVAQLDVKSDRSLGTPKARYAGILSQTVLRGSETELIMREPRIERDGTHMEKIALLDTESEAIYIWEGTTVNNPNLEGEINSGDKIKYHMIRAMADLVIDYGQPLISSSR